MSYTLTLSCGCIVYVSDDPEKPAAPVRVLQVRGAACYIARHTVGFRVWLWELLPGAPNIPDRRSWVHP
jgi:hypothetical protein